MTNDQGVYLLSALVNGTYRVTFTLASFSPIAREIEVRSGDRLRVDMTLEVGGMTEEVRVVAETPLLQTSTATRSQVIDQAKVESLPLVRPQPLRARATRVPGVVDAVHPREHQLRPFDNGGMDGISINGGVPRSNEFLLDGAPNASREGTSQGSLAFVPSPDAVQEVRVSTNTYDAQFGRTGGGIIAVSIRSGTNTVPRHRLLQPSRRQPEQQPVREQRPRHSEGRHLPLQPRLHARRAGPAAEVRRPRQDVLLLLPTRA